MGVVTPHGIVVLPTQVLHGRLVVTIDHLSTFVLLAITDSGPVLTQPPPGDASSMGPLLQWTQPPGTTWFQVQVIPFNEDGPGINLVIGDSALVQAAQYQVLWPQLRQRRPQLRAIARHDLPLAGAHEHGADESHGGRLERLGGEQLQDPAGQQQHHHPGGAAVLRGGAHAHPDVDLGKLQPAVFYYEVQLSKDYEFGPNAFLYSEYVHGGASTPPTAT